MIAGAKHEILQEQDRYRAQFWAAFDAFVPGTPLFKMTRTRLTLNPPAQSGCR